MVKKKNNLSIYIPENVKNKLPLSHGFVVYKSFNEKHLFYRDRQRRKRDIKAVEHHFPGITQILKSVKNMENECVYCRLERDNKSDMVQAALLELLQVASQTIAAEQAYSKELEYKMDICSLFLDENFHLLRIIKSLQEKIVILDNQLIKTLDNDSTEYAETVLTQYNDVKTHDIFLQDTSRGWESIDWRALELGEFELKRVYMSQESDSQSDGIINGEYYEVYRPSPYDYNQYHSDIESKISEDRAFKSHNINDLATCTNNLPVSYYGENLMNGIYTFDRLIPKPREMGFDFKSLFPDADPNHSYKSVDSYEASEISDLDAKTLPSSSYELILASEPESEPISEPISRPASEPGSVLGSEPGSESGSGPNIDDKIFKYQVSVEDLALFEELFNSRIQYLSEGSDIMRFLNAENAFLYNIIQNKLVIGNEIDLRALGETAKLKERIKIQNEHWERLEKLISSYVNNKIENDGKLYNPNLNIESVDQDLVKYLSVYASISAILSQSSFEKMLNNAITSESHIEDLVSSLNKISDKKQLENHMLNDCKLQLSIQTELCNRLASINNINVFGDSELVAEMKKNMSELKEKIKNLEGEKEDLLSDCKDAARVISMMESEIRDKSLDIDKLNAQIIDLQTRANIEIMNERSKYVAQNAESSRKEFNKFSGRDSLEGIMKRALGNCLKDLEYAESCTYTNLVSSDASTDIIYESDTDSDISISRVQNHPILPSLLSMLDRLHSGYMSLIRVLKEKCVTISRSDFDKYISLMNGLASMIRRYNTSIKYDHEIETILILMQGEYSVSNSNLLYLLNIMARLGELTQIILMDREVVINSNVSKTNAKLEMAEDKIRLLERENIKILAEKDDLKYNIKGLKREIDRFKFPVDRIANRLERNR